MCCHDVCKPLTRPGAFARGKLEVRIVTRSKRKAPKKTTPATRLGSLHLDGMCRALQKKEVPT